jgi:protein-S-isoprenylcysteine O-methyltransferase Ste14
MGERGFQNLFGVMFAIFILGQFINATRSVTRGGKYEVKEKFPIAMQVMRKSIGIVWFGAIFVYVFKPEWIAWASFPLPNWVRWVGFGIWATFMPILWWVEVSLGKNFNTTLHLREEHNLITNGPYKYIRHPMYAAQIPLILSWIPTSANWLVALPGVIGGFLVFTLRIPQEEKVMQERFGDAYQDYVDHTGRFLPRFNKRPQSGAG